VLSTTRAPGAVLGVSNTWLRVNYNAGLQITAGNPALTLDTLSGNTYGLFTTGTATPQLSKIVALSNSYGLGGHNASLVFRKYRS